MRVVTLTIAVIGMLVGSCNDSGRRTLSDDDLINEARRVLEERLSESPRSPWLAVPMLILRQPSFSGMLGDWGCLAYFDQNGTLVRAHTLKVHDFSTGDDFVIRPYSEEELRAAEADILEYVNQNNTDEEIEWIPIFSESMQLGVAEALLNLDRTAAYTIERGVGDQNHLLIVRKILSDTVEIIAADAFFHREENLQ